MYKPIGKRRARTTVEEEEERGGRRRREAGREKDNIDSERIKYQNLKDPNYFAKRKKERKKP